LDMVVYSTALAQDRNRCTRVYEHSGSIKWGKFNYSKIITFKRRTLINEVYFQLGTNVLVFRCMALCILIRFHPMQPCTLTM
jgi:hypothetical protein